MNIDINALSRAELDALLKAAKKQQKVLAKRAPINTVRRQLTLMAGKAGYTIEELFGTQPQTTISAGKPARRKKTGKVAPKYRDPENRRNTWTGRGRMPRWLVEKTRFGRSPMDFLIPGLARPTAHGLADIGKRQLVKHEPA